MKNFKIQERSKTTISSVLLVLSILLLFSINSCKDEDNIVNNSVLDDKTLTIMVRDSCFIDNPIERAKIYLAPGKNVAGPLGEEFLIGETDLKGDLNYDMKGKCEGAVYTLEVEGAAGSILQGVRRRTDSLFLTCCDDKQLVVFPVTKITINVSDDCNTLLSNAKVYLAEGSNVALPLPAENYIGQTNANGVLTFNKYIEGNSELYTIEIRGPVNSQHKDSVVSNANLELFSCSNNLNFKFKCVEVISCTGADVKKDLTSKYCIDTNKVHTFYSQEFENGNTIDLIVKYKSLTVPFPNNNPKITASIYKGNIKSGYQQDVTIAPGEKYRFGFEMESDIDATYKGVLNYSVIRADNNTVCYELILNLAFSAEKCADCPCPAQGEVYSKTDTTCNLPYPIPITTNLVNTSQKNCEWILTVEKDFDNKNAFSVTKLNNKLFYSSFSLKSGERLNNIEIEFKGAVKGLYTDSIVFAIQKKDNFSTVSCPDKIVVRVNMFKEEGDNCTDCRCPQYIEYNYPKFSDGKDKFPIPDTTCDDYKIITINPNLQNNYKDNCEWIFKVEKNFTNGDAYVFEKFNGSTGSQFSVKNGQKVSSISFRFKPTTAGLYRDTIVFGAQIVDKYGKVYNCSEKIVVRLSMYKGWSECSVNLPNSLTFPTAGKLCFSRSFDHMISYSNNGDCDLDCNIYASIVGADAMYFKLDKTQIDGIPKKGSTSFKITFIPTCLAVLTKPITKTKFDAELRITSSCNLCPSKNIPLTGNANDDKILCGRTDQGDPTIEEKTQGIAFNFFNYSWQVGELNTIDYKIYASNIDASSAITTDWTVTLNTIAGGKFELLATGRSLASGSSPCEFWDEFDFTNKCGNNVGPQSITVKQGDLILLSLPDGTCAVIWINQLKKDGYNPPKKDVKLSLCYINCK